MAQPEKTEPLVPKSRIDNLFDIAELIVDRLERLLMKAKYVVFALAFLLFLIYEMIRFGKFLFAGH